MSALRASGVREVREWGGEQRGEKRGESCESESESEKLSVGSVPIRRGS